MDFLFADIGAKGVVLYKEFISYFPNYVGVLINFLILLLMVVIYAIFIWKFYTLLSRKNLLELDLKKYNHYEESFRSRLTSGALYFLENIIISPFVIFIAFAIFTFFLIILSQNQEVSQTLIIAAVIIGAIRMTSYYKEELSKDIAKILPLTLLAVAVLNPSTFAKGQYIETILNHFTQIPNFFREIFYYLIFIVALEIVLRFFDLVYSLFKLEKNVVEEGKEEKQKYRI